MSRATNLTYRIALLGVLFALAFQAALARVDGPKDIPISSLMRRMPVSDFVKLVGPETLLDTIYQPVGKGPLVKVIRFAPLRFEGFLAICEADLSNDSVTTINLYLPYVPRRDAKPDAPYALHGFVRATLDDFNTLRDNIEKSLGEPTVSTETYIDYMPDGIQTVFGSLKGSNITISIYPQAKVK